MFGRFQIGPAIAADVGVSQIVRHDVDDVRLRRPRLTENIVDTGSDCQRTECRRLQDITSCR